MFAIDAPPIPPSMLPVGQVTHLDAVPLHLCDPHPRNYNQHRPEQIENIKYSLKIFGQVRSIVLQAAEDGRFLIVAGHGVCLAARLLGWGTIRADIIPAEWHESLVLAYLGVDNELARQSNPDQQQLAMLTATVHEQAGEQLATIAAGSANRLAELRARIDLQQIQAGGIDEDPGPQVDEPEQLLKQWPVEEGQVWEIPSRTVPGQVHRLRCGDSRDRYGIAHLMADHAAEWMWTDPPYGVGYVGRTKDALTITGDAVEDLEPLLMEAFAAVNPFLVSGAPIYIAHGSGANTEVFMRCFRIAAGWHLHQDLVWIKQHMVLGRSDYQHQHETIMYGWKPGAERPWFGDEEDQGDTDYAVDHGSIAYGWKPGRHPWYGGRTRRSVIPVPRPMRSTFHPTAKPPTLVAIMIVNSSKVGSLGVDPFVGYGSTIVAAERCNRLAYGQDLERKYVAATLERLALMGLRPALVEDASGHRLA
jgi:DNA modification methylase